MIDFNRLDHIILDNNSFLITTHVNPDADAIGSEIALYLILKKLGKKAYIVNFSSTPYNLTFLDQNIIMQFNEYDHAKLFEEVDVLAALDFNNPNRIVKMEPFFSSSKKLKICIDHHQHPEKFVDYFFIDPDYSSTGQIIYDLVKNTEIVKMSYDIAVPIYSAIMTDTGSFRFDRTTPAIHKIAAELIELGVNPTEIYDKIYDQSNYGKVKLLGESLATIKLNKTGEIAYMIITRDALLKTGTDESEVDGFVNFCLSIAGVKVGILFFELKDGMKISFRSKGNIPVNLLAEELGGGGHINAAGTRLFQLNTDGFIDNVIEKAETYLNYS